MQGTITIQGLTLYCYHGVAAAEKQLGGKYEIDIHADYDFTAIVASDAINDGVDYSGIISTVTHCMKASSYNTIEHIAGLVGRTLLQDFPRLQAVTVILRKYAVPVEASIAFTQATLRLQQ